MNPYVSKSHAIIIPAGKSIKKNSNLSAFKMVHKRKSPGQPPYVLKLFVTTYSTSSHRAIRNLTAILKDNFQGIYELQIIDIKESPLAALGDNVIAVPLLIKEKPEPYTRLVGDMSDREKVLASLGLPARNRP
jgi:circadian clock protein KaiB